MQETECELEKNEETEEWCQGQDFREKNEKWAKEKESEFSLEILCVFLIQVCQTVILS